MVESLSRSRRCLLTAHFLSLFPFITNIPRPGVPAGPCTARTFSWAPVDQFSEGEWGMGGTADTALQPMFVDGVAGELAEGCCGLLRVMVDRSHVRIPPGLRRYRIFGRSRAIHLTCDLFRDPIDAVIMQQSAEEKLCSAARRCMMMCSKQAIRAYGCCTVSTE